MEIYFHENLNGLEDVSLHRFFKGSINKFYEIFSKIRIL